MVQCATPKRGGKVYVVCEVENHRHSVRHGHFTEIRKQLKVRTFLACACDGAVRCRTRKEIYELNQDHLTSIKELPKQLYMIYLPFEETVPALPARIHMICRDRLY